MDTKVIIIDNVIKTQIYTKRKKFPVHWTSNVPIKYKRNAVKGGLHRTKKIATDYNVETKRIFAKYISAGVPKKFVKNIKMLVKKNPL